MKFAKSGIWPVNPVLEGEDRAAALWLENPGKAPITLQIGIYAWAQADGKSVYAPQDDVLATPPIVTIPPGAKQLVRLTRLTPPPAEAERPYRIIVDEIPALAPADAAKAPGAAVRFRMRYSLPLFSYAKGEGPKAVEAAKKQATLPALTWRVGDDANGRYLEIRNDGPVHARLTEAAFGTGTAQSSVSRSLLGYILAGSMARWPLPAEVQPTGDLRASVNGAPPTALAPQPR
jgi:fimbrial chaperone protein